MSQLYQIADARQFLLQKIADETITDPIEITQKRRRLWELMRFLRAYWGEVENSLAFGLGVAVKDAAFGDVHLAKGDYLLYLPLDNPVGEDAALYAFNADLTYLGCHDVATLKSIELRHNPKEARERLLKEDQDDGD